MHAKLTQALSPSKTPGLASHERIEWQNRHRLTATVVSELSIGLSIGKWLRQQPLRLAPKLLLHLQLLG